MALHRLELLLGHRGNSVVVAGSIDRIRGHPIFKLLPVLFLSAFGFCLLNIW